jgi:hypothetical protein
MMLIPKTWKPCAVVTKIFCRLPRRSARGRKRDGRVPEMLDGAGTASSPNVGKWKCKFDGEEAVSAPAVLSYLSATEAVALRNGAKCARPPAQQRRKSSQAEIFSYVRLLLLLVSWIENSR